VSLRSRRDRLTSALWPLCRNLLSAAAAATAAAPPASNLPAHDPALRRRTSRHQTLYWPPTGSRTGSCCRLRQERYPSQAWPDSPPVVAHFLLR